MAGLYLHIPFCSKACVYCDFHFSTNLSRKAEVVNAIQKEIEWQQNYLDGQTLNSVYFGGGTPSLLSESELMSLLETTHHNFKVANDAEITLEANPDDLSKEKLKMLESAGINRLSIGVQSFRDEDLHFMNRSHKAAEIEIAVKTAQDVGLTNLSIDLIYSIPGLSNQAWMLNMEKALLLDVPHISAYSLTVEEKTVLYHKIEKGEIPAPSETQAEEQFKLLDKLNDAGFEHYEISNLAKTNCRAKHNSSYWKGANYLGVGPSAHSFNGKSRQWNVSNNFTYLKAIKANEIPHEKELLTEADQYNEYIMTNLRRLEGVDRVIIFQLFGEKFSAYLLAEAKAEITKGNLIEQNGAYSIPQEKRFYSDGIAASLFYI